MFPDWVIAHVPNGGNRSAQEAAKFKRMGVLAGYPDLIIHGPKVFALVELKTAKGSRSEKQIALHAKLEALGAYVFTIDNLNDFMHLCFDLSSLSASLHTSDKPSRSQEH